MCCGLVPVLFCENRFERQGGHGCRRRRRILRVGLAYVFELARKVRIIVENDRVFAVFVARELYRNVVVVHGAELVGVRKPVQNGVQIFIGGFLVDNVNVDFARFLRRGENDIVSRLAVLILRVLLAFEADYVLFELQLAVFVVGIGKTDFHIKPALAFLKFDGLSGFFPVLVCFGLSGGIFIPLVSKVLSEIYGILVFRERKHSIIQRSFAVLFAVSPDFGVRSRNENRRAVYGHGTVRAGKIYTEKRRKRD